MNFLDDSSGTMASTSTDTINGTGQAPVESKVINIVKNNNK